MANRYLVRDDVECLPPRPELDEQCLAPGLLEARELLLDGCTEVHFSCVLADCQQTLRILCAHPTDRPSAGETPSLLHAACGLRASVARAVFAMIFHVLDIVDQPSAPTLARKRRMKPCILHGNFEFYRPCYEERSFRVISRCKVCAPDGGKLR
eukprot:s766_g6.t1